MSRLDDEIRAGSVATANQAVVLVCLRIIIVALVSIIAMSTYACVAYAQVTVSLDDWTATTPLRAIEAPPEPFAFEIVPQGKRSKEWKARMIVLAAGVFFDLASTYDGLDRGLVEVGVGKEGANFGTIAGIDAVVLGVLWWLNRRYPDSRILRVFTWTLGAGKLAAGARNWETGR